MNEEDVKAVTTNNYNSNKVLSANLARAFGAKGGAGLRNGSPSAERTVSTVERRGDPL